MTAILNLKITVKWGFLLGLAQVVATQLLTWAGLGTSIWFVVLTYLLVAGFTALSIQKIRQLSEGGVSFLSLALHLLIAIIISRYLFQLYMFVYVNYIDPDWIAATSALWAQEMLAQGLSADQISTTLGGFQHAYESLPMFSVEIVRYGVSQYILALLVSLFFVFRKNK